MDTNNKTVEELNELLYEKMEFEQAEYRQLLVDMESPEIVWCDTTVKTVLILLGAYVLVILIYVTSHRNYRPREEHGAAKWGKTAQLRKYRNKEKPEDAKILTQDTSISLKGRFGHFSFLSICH